MPPRLLYNLLLGMVVRNVAAGVGRHLYRVCLGDILELILGGHCRNSKLGLSFKD
jgi:hypothetical protein